MQTNSRLFLGMKISPGRADIVPVLQFHGRGHKPSKSGSKLMGNTGLVRPVPVCILGCCQHIPDVVFDTKLSCCSSEDFS